MAFTLGIGIITYNRRDIVAHTIDRVREFTCWPDAALVVADDGSTDGTPEMLNEKQVGVVTGVNMGIAWNKNRALFLLAQILRCDTMILLEDDAHPSRHGWETDWIAATNRWGHINYAGDWLNESIESGAGTPEDPFLSLQLTAQCAAYSRASLAWGGYFHPRFKGWGHEHVEHSGRLVRAGFGGHEERTESGKHVWYRSIAGHVTAVFCPTHATAEKEAENRRVAHEVMEQPQYCAPWENDEQRNRFRSEIESAMGAGSEWFRLTPPLSLTSPQDCGVFNRIRSA